MNVLDATEYVSVLMRVIWINVDENESFIDSKMYIKAITKPVNVLHWTTVFSSFYRAA